MRARGRGISQQLTAVARDSIGNPLLGRSISWTSRDTAIATVSASGLATGRVLGATHIVATAEGRSDSVAFTVTSAAAPRIASISSQPRARATAPSPQPGRRGELRGYRPAAQEVAGWCSGAVATSCLAEMSSRSDNRSID
ncbi:MAG: Ig-like domain-containing protein [Gemmatimonadaceae bacterium]